MKRNTKRVLGLLGLVLVVAMTVFATFLPGPEASATTSVTDTMSLRVLDGKPSADIRKFEDGDAQGDNVTSSLDQPVIIDYTHMSEFNITITEINPDGSEGESTEISHVVLTPEEENGTYSQSLRDYLSDYGYGKYKITVEGIGIDGMVVKDSREFEFVAATTTVIQDEETGSAIVDINYGDNGDTGLSDDEKVAKIVIDVYDEYGHPVVARDENGNEIPGVFPITIFPSDSSSHIEIPFEDYNLPSGKYLIKVTSYNAAGDVLYRPLTKELNYQALPVPSAADTGGLFKNMNISQTDYLITGVGIFLVVGIGGAIFINKRSKASRTRRRR